MKKIEILLFSFLLTYSLAACGNQGQEAIKSRDMEHLTDNSTNTDGTESGGVESGEDAEESFEAEREAEPEESHEQKSAQEPAESTGDSNILIVYFSRYGNTEYPDDVDATTSASIVADETGRYGTTKWVANMIQQAVGGDVHRIETVIPFCTHDGYGAGSTYQAISEASHAAVSPEGIAIEAKDVPAAQDTVNDWHFRRL